MTDALARLDARARIVRRVAVLAVLPPLACHLAAPSLGVDAAPAVAIAEVAAAAALRLAGVSFSAPRLRRPRVAREGRHQGRSAAMPRAAIG